MPNAIFFKVRLVGGKFQDSMGNPLSNGSLVWTLSHDSNVCVLGGPTGTQVVSQISVTTPLDNIGNIVKGYSLWPNDQLTPLGSYYVVRAYDSNGVEIWNAPQYFEITGIPATSGASVDVGTLQPLEP